MNLIDQLYHYVSQYTTEDIAVAFSGGVDSAVILHAACHTAQQSGKKVYAIFAQTSLHPVNEADVACHVAKEMGAECLVLKVDELKEAGIENNPKNRCYLCKRCIYEKMQKVAAEKGVRRILEGTNEDDLHTYRPGIQALKELGIISPLAQLGITKNQVRQMALSVGISVAQRPSSPCLATRLPYDTPLDYELLQKIDQGEQLIRDLGFRNVRLRVHGDIVRIEVDEEDISRLTEYRKDIVTYLKRLGFRYVTVDFSGFVSGSMDI